MKISRYLLMLGLALSAQSAGAAIIDYTLAPLGGNSYRYEYRVTNDGSLGPGISIELFDIYFDDALYDFASLTIDSSDPPASDWDEQIFGSGILVEPAYDAFALAGGIAEGVSVAGFAVQFDWLGTGLPGPQPFEVYDATTFDLLTTGTTRSPIASVPEPSTLALLLIAAFVGVLTSRRASELSSAQRLS